MANFVEELVAKINSRTGPVLVLNEDERRIERRVETVAKNFTSMNVWTWRATTGLSLFSGDRRNGRDNPNVNDPNDLIQEFDSWKSGPSIVICYDLCSVTNRIPTAVFAARRLRDFGEKMKTPEKNEGIVQVVVVDREKPQIPMGLNPLVLEMPGPDELGLILDAIVSVVDPEIGKLVDRTKVLNALAGLPANEAEDALSEAFSRTTDQTTREDLLREISYFKRSKIAESALDWVDPDLLGMEGVGGLENMKAWIESAKAGFDPALAKEYNLSAPAGMLLCGVPGTGKSATAKALAGELGFALVSYSGGAMSKFLGESEEKFRKMLVTASAIAPCVLFVDEVEKIFASSGSGETDGGVSERIAGMFLTWLQEKKSTVFVVMTANDPRKLKPELLRAGRLDEKFWIDVPNLAERKSIVNVMCRRYPKADGIDHEKLARESQDWTGAEIEGAIKKALRTAMVTKSEVTTESVLSALESTPKVLLGWKDRLQELREWAGVNCVPASVPDAQATSSAPVRRIGIK
jgi:hypothetical protein